MNKKNLMLVPLFAAFLLTACDPVDETDTDDTTDTEETTDETDDGDDSTDETSSTSRPADVDSFSLSVTEAAVPDALNTDGITLSVNVQVADHNNNPVDDGQEVTFWAEFGRITETCETSDGACSVTWTSGGNRPLDGLVTVTAYTVGEDTFFDSDIIDNLPGTDGVYDVGETIIRGDEVIKDYNYDGFTSGIFLDGGTGLTIPGDGYVDYNEDGVFNQAGDENIYRGESCTAAAISADHCDETSIHVWDTTQLSLSTINMQATTLAAWTTGNSYSIIVSDTKGNYPPVGTTVAIEPKSDGDAVVNIFGEVTALGESGPGSYTFSAFVSEVTVGGDFYLVITSPSGGVVRYSITIN